ncbi:MAG: T9SS type A sorting domain-containing protein [Bacteroidetes bacterium]|nr:T9SS type A sorting domain-containing protein [Bacteroidota bacterium]
MKKFFLLPLAVFLFSQLVFAQQKKHSPFFEKIQSKSEKVRQGESVQVRTLSLSHSLTSSLSPFRAGATSLPTPNSIWQPGKRIESRWDTISSSWMFNDSVLSSYNINGDVTLEETYSSSGLFWQTIYTYNANAKLTQLLGQYWNGSAWDNMSRTNYSYDANNNLIQETIQNWNTSLSSWDNFYQQLSAYDINNNPIQYIGQNWNTTTSSWDNSWKENDTYNVNNQLIQYIGQNWNTTTSSWDNSWKEDLTYSSGVIISAIDYSWNVTTWDIDTQYINIVWYQWTGDLNTSLIQSYTAQIWNGASWDNDYRDTYTYDAQANNTDYLSEVWQTSAWVTDYEYKNIFAYDANNNITQDIIQDWVQWLMAVRNYWRIDYSNYTLYSAIDESSSANGNILIYPNPSNGVFNVQMSGFENVQMNNIEVYNVMGEKMYSEKILNPKSLILNLAVPNGIYFLQLHPVGYLSNGVKTNAGVAIKKLVISH